MCTSLTISHDAGLSATPPRLLGHPRSSSRALRASHGGRGGSIFGAIDCTSGTTLTKPGRRVLDRVAAEATEQLELTVDSKDVCYIPDWRVQIEGRKAPPTVGSSLNIINRRAIGLSRSVKLQHIVIINLSFH